jgi:hypothetical protein
MGSGGTAQGRTKPVVALDLDGTLGDYHTHFTRFAEAWTGREMPPPEEINPGVPLHKHLRLSKRTYRECKLAYRRGGLKRSMPCYDGAADLVRHMRKSGAEAWFTTTRPYLKFDGIDGDTRHWLRRNGLKGDGLIFSDTKLNDLISAVGRERIILVVDDLPEICQKAQVLGLPWVLRDQPYNRHWDVGPVERRVLDINELRAAFGRAMYKWEEDHAAQ